MVGPVFVDTNVFVYRHDNSVPAKQSDLAESRTGRLSYQVLQELPAESNLLSAWQPLAIDPGVLERAWQVQERWAVSWWDALIIGAAQASECPVLLTEDLQAGQVFDGVTAIDPFTLANLTPEDVLNA